MTWSLFKYLRRRRYVTKQVISNPTFIVDPEEIHGEIATKKEIINEKSEKNLARLDAIKCTLLKWKEENDRIFTHYETEDAFFSPRKLAKSEMTQSMSFDSIITLEDRVLAWREKSQKHQTVIAESDSSDCDTENSLQVIYRKPAYQEFNKRPERANSFKALGKALIKEEKDNCNKDFF